MTDLDIKITPSPKLCFSKLRAGRLFWGGQAFGKVTKFWFAHLKSDQSFCGNFLHRGALVDNENRKAISIVGQKSQGMSSLTFRKEKTKGKWVKSTKRLAWRFFFFSFVRFLTTKSRIMSDTALHIVECILYTDLNNMSLRQMRCFS